MVRVEGWQRRAGGEPAAGDLLVVIAGATAAGDYESRPRRRQRLVGVDKVLQQELIAWAKASWKGIRPRQRLCWLAEGQVCVSSEGLSSGAL